MGTSAQDHTSKLGSIGDTDPLETVEQPTELADQSQPIEVAQAHTLDEVALRARDTGHNMDGTGHGDSFSMTPL